MLLRALKPSRRRRSPSQSTSAGQSLVEFVLIVPIMLLLVAVAIDFGRLFYAYIAVEDAAKEGALVGARSPVCNNNVASGCADPNNVIWHVENEAPNLVDPSGNSLLTSTVACRTAAGALVQPISDCLDGYTYQVTVSTPFKLITPILSSFFPPTITLSKMSQATVITDGFDPSGLEVLVWTETANATNASAIATACVPADSVNAPGFYYQPCQDATNVDNYLTFPEGATVNYRVRVKNTGNVSLSSITYTFQENGTPFTKPAACNTLPTSLAAGAAAATCSFSRTTVVTNPAGGVNQYTVAIESTAQAGGLSTGTNTVASTVNVPPKPRLVVNLKAGQYRLGSTGDGFLGLPQFASGNLGLKRDPAASLTEVKNPVAWFRLTVANQGGPAANLSVGVTQAGNNVPLPGYCAVPSSLAASGQPGDSFNCTFSQSLTATQAYPYAATASATNALNAGGQRNVDVTTTTCTGANRVVPNLVDTLTPSPDLSSKTVGAARSAWTAGGFTGSLGTTPAGGADSLIVQAQNQAAYSCAAAGTNVVVTTP